ncbi:fungal-specific transcription factor domain containing protein [Elaphomyces granulatus]
MAPKRMRTVEGSCWPCKDRRVICDLQRPRCSRCAASSQPCGYGKVRLRWCNGVAARGRFAGQNIPIPAPGGEGAGEEEEEEEEEEEVEGVEDEGEDEGEEGAAAAAAAAARSSLSLRAPATDLTSDQLLLYFEHEVVDRFNLSPDPLLIDLLSISKDPAVQQSVTAVANAHHFLYMRQTPKAGTLAKRKARQDAIQLFRRQLQQSPISAARGESAAAGLFLTNVLFCILDGMIDPNEEAPAALWHFRGGIAILNWWKPADQLFRMKKGLPALMVSIFSTIDLTNALLTGQAPYFHHSIWANFAGSDGWWGVLPVESPFLGVMGILSQLAEMGNAVRESNTLSVSRLRAILAALRESDVVMQEQTASSQSSSVLAQYLPSPPWSPPSPLDSEGPETLNHEQSWYVFCKAYRLSALIYIYRVFYGLGVTHPLVQQATMEGVRAICGSRLMGKLAHCLLFPSLVVGSHCLTEEHQSAIGKSLQTTSSFLYFGSTRLMERFLQKLWEKEDTTLDWWQCFDEISRKAFLF